LTNTTPALRATPPLLRRGIWSRSAHMCQRPGSGGQLQTHACPEFATAAALL